MLTVTENTTQQINAALFEQDQNVKNKLSTVSGVVSAVYGACEWIFNKLKESLARVATTGSYNDLTDKPTIVDTVAQNVPNAVSSNAVYGALTNVMAKSFSGRLGEIRCAKDNCNFTNGQYIWDLSNSFVKDYNGFICVATGEGINVTISGLQTDVSGKKITLNAKVLSNGSNYTGSLEVNLMVLAFN